MTSRPALDVSPLPTVVFSHRSTLWWATMGIVLIESTMFALVVFAYFYLRGRVSQWPPGLSPPNLTWGLVNLVVLLASAVPNAWTKKAAERQDLRRVRRWIVICELFGLAFIAVRWLEFGALNCSWDSNAYGSAVWTIMGLHTAHLVTDWLNTSVLAALLFTGPVEEKRFMDAAENAMYWYFVVFAWVPLFGIVYLAPRWL